MTDQNVQMLTQTYRERFVQACETHELERHESPARHAAYLVTVTSTGQKHYVDGPFFTYAEAEILAAILRKSCRNARATSAFYQDHPAITQKLIKDCQDSRARLAKDLELK
ncbi:hypothetical protein ACFMKY_26330 [Pseudomonas protegens]|uniref:hypothetical protein n=1 Tax=Pseudomonas protegens TaxID=380021 RepID=UPI00366C92C9